MGDSDGRRDEYLKGLCRELHGLPKDFNKSVKASQNRIANIAAKKAIKGIEAQERFTGRVPPRFDRDFWEIYWRDNPEELPDIGSNVEECFQNFQNFVGCSSITLPLNSLRLSLDCLKLIEKVQIKGKGDRDKRRDEYLKAKCRRLHNLEVDPVKGIMAVEGKKVAQAAREARDEMLEDRKAGQSSPAARRLAAKRIREAQIANELPTRRDGSPLFSRDYWEKYWKRHPETMPPKGENFDECLENLLAFVRDFCPTKLQAP